MHLSANFQAPPNAVDFLWFCEGMWRGLSSIFMIKIDHLKIDVLLEMIMIDKCNSTYNFYLQKA